MQVKLVCKKPGVIFQARYSQKTLDKFRIFAVHYLIHIKN